ncbi:hypothetical protein CPAV1605_579 [seawater metagenome]|uniref:Uncharacterized protein n=1 Tax=seawater metagenome TaxID=1561972 RepID=A0A5E8CJP4_9ZZZZ
MQHFTNQKEDIINEYNSIKENIKKLQKQLSPLENKIKSFKLIDRFDLNYNQNLDQIKNITFENEYQCVSGSEYCSTENGRLVLSYDFHQSNNNIINVKFTLNFSREESYKNKYNSYVEITFDLENNSNDFVEIDTNNDNIPCEVYLNGDPLYDVDYFREDNEITWASLLSVIINYILGNTGNLVELLEFN